MPIPALGFVLETTPLPSPHALNQPTPPHPTCLLPHIPPHTPPHMPPTPHPTPHTLYISPTVRKSTFFLLLTTKSNTTILLKSFLGQTYATCVLFSPSLFILSLGKNNYMLYGEKISSDYRCVNIAFVKKTSLYKYINKDSIFQLFCLTSLATINMLICQ